MELCSPVNCSNTALQGPAAATVTCKDVFCQHNAAAASAAAAAAVAEKAARDLLHVTTSSSGRWEPDTVTTACVQLLFPLLSNDTLVRPIPFLLAWRIKGLSLSICSNVVVTIVLRSTMTLLMYTRNFPSVVLWRRLPCCQSHFAVVATLHSSCTRSCSAQLAPRTLIALD